MLYLLDALKSQKRKKIEKICIVPRLAGKHFSAFTRKVKIPLVVKARNIRHKMAAFTIKNSDAKIVVNRMAPYIKSPFLVHFFSLSKKFVIYRIVSKVIFVINAGKRRLLRKIS